MVGFLVRRQVGRRVEREIADVGIGLLLLCDRLGIDLLVAIRKKVQINVKPVGALGSGSADGPHGEQDVRDGGVAGGERPAEVVRDHQRIEQTGCAGVRR